MPDRIQSLEDFIELMPDAVVVVAPDGSIVLVNNLATELFGYCRAELVGKHVDMLLPGDRRATHAVARARYDGQPEVRGMAQGRELYALRKNGSKVSVDISLSPVDSGSRRAVLATVRDLTERQKHLDEISRKSAELERSNQALQEFAYVASHDLREPLRTVSSFLSLLLRRHQDKLDAEAREFIDFSVSGTDRMQALIDALLEYSRIDTRGKSFERVGLEDALREVLDGLKVNLEETRAKIVVEGELPQLEADRVQLRQLLQNLIANGIKFHDPDHGDPIVRISVEDEGPEWRVAVADNGIGIEPRFAERIFAVFQRLHSRESYSGTGIGLAVCKRIVERHGGRIWIESRPGEGTSFYFTWPKTNAASTGDGDDYASIDENRNNPTGGG